MFYATAGQQATQPPPPPGARAPSSQMSQGGGGGVQPQNQSGFPPIAGVGAAGGMGRSSGPPGFSGRSSDTNDFPALSSLISSQHSHQNSTYASQAQPPPPSSSGHAQLQQQLYLQQQQQMNGLAPPPPPPGLSGPMSPLGGPQGLGNGSGGGGAVGDSREDFPALSGGMEKDRMSNYLKHSQNSHIQSQSPSSPPTTTTTTAITNGGAPSTSTTTSNPLPSLLGNPTSTTTTTNGPPSTGTADSSSLWPRQSPSTRPLEPLITRPVQQIMSSPVDKWGLKALLYEIKTQMGKGDRGVLVFGEELSDLGIDVGSDEALYSTLVTPWAEPTSIPQPIRIEESYHIPSCYLVHAPAVSTKLPNFAEDTLFYAFYSSPGDLLQLEVAEELYNRGWRYHTELQMWLTSTLLQNIELPPPPPSTSSSSDHNPSASSNNNSNTSYLRGPFIVFDHRTFQRQKTPDDFGINLFDLEVTRGIASASINGQEGKIDGKSNGHGQLQQQMGGGHGQIQNQGQGQGQNGIQSGGYPSTR